jgi:hypothetical protein
LTPGPGNRKPSAAGRSLKLAIEPQITIFPASEQTNILFSL